MIETKLVTAIEAVPGLAGRVVPLLVPEGTEPPYVVYVSHGTTEDQCLSGWMGSYTTEVEINVVHQTYKAMKELAALVVAALQEVDEVVSINENAAERYEAELGAYRKIINVRLMH